MQIDRRSLLKSSSLLLAGATLSSWPLSAAAKGLPAFYEDIERRTFQWFWHTVNRKNGLVPDRWPSPSFSSIAAVGFALPAYAIGAGRGWCTREEARDLTLTTLRFFWNAPEGPQATGTTGYKGFFYHFLDMETGLRFRNTELSSVDTSILLMGALFAGQYFDREDAAEREIRKLAQNLYARADWNHFRSDGRMLISMGWHPESGLIARSWDGFNEGLFVQVLALGAPVHQVPAEIWAESVKPYPVFWRGSGPWRRLAFAPLFGQQFSHIWIDFRGIRDAPMREAGMDYFENARRETYANRAYCIANPMKWQGYSPSIWGLSACDGPGDLTLPYGGGQRTFFGYAARGPMDEPDGRDDGTITPTAALGCLPFAPEIVIPAAQAMREWPGLFDQYGFHDSFNPSFTYAGVRIETGSVNSRTGWVAKDYLGLDQGPILLQAANFRNDFIWRYMRRVPAIRRGLQRAGFTGGWLG